MRQQRPGSFSTEKSGSVAAVSDIESVSPPVIYPLQVDSSRVVSCIFDQSVIFVNETDARD